MRTDGFLYTYAVCNLHLDSSGISLLLIIFQTVPISIVALHKNKTISLTVFDQASAFQMSCADNTPFEFRGFNIFLKHSPDFIDFFVCRGGTSCPPLVQCPRSGVQMAAALAGSFT